MPEYRWRQLLPRLSSIESIILYVILLRSLCLSAAVLPPSSEALGVDLVIWFSLRTDGQAGSGTLADPFNGTAPWLDQKLGELSSSRVTNIQLRFMPGTYETRGYAAWHIRSGWKIQGSGIDVTTLKAVDAANRRGAVIGVDGYEPGENMEVSDVTIDCNYSSSHPSLFVAVNLNGSRHSIRRVKAINAYGSLDTFENFVIAISSYYADSEGNLIEDCEVSNFKGTFCTAIGFSGGVVPNRFISGIIRGNKVYDLRARRAPGALIALGGGAMKNVLFEDNYAYRCDIGVNIDTGRSMNLTFKNNQFIACRLRGILVIGQIMDTVMIENNFIEINPTAMGYAIQCWDHSGVYKLRNFTIQNNTIRAQNGRAGLSGGIGVALANNGENFMIRGNRVDAGLRSAISGPGIVCFDNTDFSGRPLNMLPGQEGDQVNLPVGERGTLLLNKGTAYIVAETTSNSVANGGSLVRTYARARAMRPHGQPLSATNRATVFLFPGTYTVSDSALVLDAPFVDLAGVGNASGTRIESQGNVLVQTANDVHIENLTLHCSSQAPLSFTSSDRAAYFPSDNLPRTIIKNCIFSTANNGLGMRLGVTYSGYYEGCHAGALAFGAGRFAGFAKNCTAGHNSFGGGGMLISCQIGGAINSAVPFTGKLNDCRVGPVPDSLPCVLVGQGASLYNSTLLANTSGNTFSIDAASPVQARVAHCRLNRPMRNVTNLLTEGFNIEDPNLD